jgi:hypothetical protein
VKRLAVAALILGLGALAVVAGYRVLGRPATPAPPADAGERATTPGERAAPPADLRGFLYGRVAAADGAVYEGRLRWGGGEEAFWSDTFNGVEPDNPWVALVPPERRPTERDAVEIFGLTVFDRERPLDLARPFLARFGDLVRIEAEGREVRVTTKGGTTVVLDRLEASDFDDGLRVWDLAKGVVDLDSTAIRAVELLPTGRVDEPAARLYGTVHADGRELTGFVRWNREEGLGSDQLDGHSGGWRVALRYDEIRAIERLPGKGARVTRRDGDVLEITDSQEVGEENRGLFVDDPRYGRVLVYWRVFERVDFADPPGGGSGPGYDDFPPGRPLAGAVTTRDGSRLAGRLVYDLDESETTETLDASTGSVSYNLPFELVAAIVPASDGEPNARVTLRSGEELRLAPTGDLGERHAGLLVFAAGEAPPEYVAWSEVARIEFDTAATLPPP